jgi:hypothetical protein
MTKVFEWEVTHPPKPEESGTEDEEMRKQMCFSWLKTMYSCKS